MQQIYCLLLALLCVYGLKASDDYLPLVREGVKWVYAESASFCVHYEDRGEVPHAYTEHRTYTIEFRGDTVIDGRRYKKAFRTSDMDLNRWPENAGYTSAMIPAAFFREEAQQRDSHYVYAIRNKEVPQYMPSDYDYLWPLFDGLEFNGEKYMYGKEYLAYYFHVDFNTDSVGEVLIGGNSCTVYIWANQYTEARIVEGVGAPDADGDLITPYLVKPHPGEYDIPSTRNRRSDSYVLDCDSTWVYLHHLEDADGHIIFKGPAFDDGMAPADFDRSGAVDIDDLNQCINRLLASESVDVTCDVTGDGRVDIDDVNAVIKALLKKQ
ncbi:MAG: hypothetical protein IJT30_09750 [Muribaculaceae bacterium]|nr:hypothetical protein [Muribaculaceae bacterium]